MSRTLVMVVMASFAGPTLAETGGGMLTALRPLSFDPPRVAAEPDDEEAPDVAFEVPGHLRPGPRVYVRGAGGLTSVTLFGDFDPAAYPNVTPFFPPIGVIEPERAESDPGFVVGGAIGLRIPWSHEPDHAHGATRIEAEYMFRTASLDRVVYEEEFGVRPEADISGRFTGHSVMGNVIAEWWVNPDWRLGVGGGAGVLFSEVEANGRRDSGAAFAAQAIGTAEYRLTEQLWLTMGLTLLGAADVDYDTDIQSASTLAVDLTLGLSFEF